MSARPCKPVTCRHVTWPACRCTPSWCAMLDAKFATRPAVSWTPGERRATQVYRVVPLHTGEPALGRSWVEVLGYNLAIVGVTRLGGG